MVDENTAAPEGEQQSQEAAPTQDAAGTGAPTGQSIPYDRFNEVNTQKNTYKSEAEKLRQEAEQYKAALARVAQIDGIEDYIKNKQAEAEKAEQLKKQGWRPPEQSPALPPQFNDALGKVQQLEGTVAQLQKAQMQAALEREYQEAQKFVDSTGLAIDLTDAEAMEPVRKLIETYRGGYDKSGQYVPGLTLSQAIQLAYFAPVVNQYHHEAAAGPVAVEQASHPMSFPEGYDSDTFARDLENA
jgi:hypothetical protein